MYRRSSVPWAVPPRSQSRRFTLQLGGGADVPPPTSGPGAGTADPTATSAPVKVPKSRRTSIYAGVGVAIIVVMVILAWAVTGGFHLSGTPSGSSGYVLVPRGTSYSMVIGQFNGIDFDVNSTSHIEGQVNSSRGIAVYILTPADFAYLVKNLTVGPYVWTTGVVADGTPDTLNIPVQPGQWVLSFVNPNVSWPTGVTFYSDLTLTTG